MSPNVAGGDEACGTYRIRLAVPRVAHPSYFGQELEAARCGFCDNGVLGRSSEEPTENGRAPFSVGDRVVHTAFGGGTVQRATADTITVLFDTVGYKTLAARRAVEQGMLEAEPGAP